MHDNHFTSSDKGIPCVLGPMVMTLSNFIDILRSPSSLKVIENTGKVLHPLSQLTGTDFKIFVTGVIYLPQVHCCWEGSVVFVQQ